MFKISNEVVAAIVAKRPYNRYKTRVTSRDEFTFITYKDTNIATINWHAKQVNFRYCWRATQTSANRINAVLEALCIDAVAFVRNERVYIRHNDSYWPGDGLTLRVFHGQWISLIFK